MMAALVAKKASQIEPAFEMFVDNLEQAQHFVHRACPNYLDGM